MPTCHWQRLARFTVITSYSIHYTKLYDLLLDSQPHFGEAIASFVSECERDRPYTRITRPGDLHIGLRREASSEEKQLLADLAEDFKKGGLFTVKLVDDSYNFV